MPFLPVTVRELHQNGIKTPDFVLVSADAYVDHPSFGAAIIGRVLEAAGYSVAVLAQPNWRTDEDFKRFGRPALGFLIAGGNIDSMVNHYTVARKKRREDSYSPGGKSGLRPDRPSIVYSQRIRSIYKDSPIIIGGIEGSLRRLSHYDYWDDKVRQSLLVDAGADIIVYGMAERSIVELAEKLKSGVLIGQINDVPGTVYRIREKPQNPEYIFLPAFRQVCDSKEHYAQSFKLQHQNTEAQSAKTLVESYDTFYVVQNPPAAPLSADEMDHVYQLGYMRAAHPIYDDAGGVPALAEVKYSLISNRGCFGACNFCALCFHQGRTVQVRSHQSLLDEARKMVAESGFKGYIHDVGGPTANFRGPACEKQWRKGSCDNRKCLFPTACKNLKVSHQDYLALLRALRALPGVKKVFIRSGIRYDYLSYDKNEEFFKELCQHHVSGQLKVAPEHVSPGALMHMGKPAVAIYQEFVRRYTNWNKKLGKKQYIVPYFMSSHPGCTLLDAVALAEYLRDIGHMPQQVQDFYPTPGTLSTCMYYTGLNPLTNKPVYVAKTTQEKATQRALMQYRLPQNKALVLEALKKAGREDLIGFDSKCLIRPTAFGTHKSGAPKKATNQTPIAGIKKKKKTIRNIHKKKKG